jgi:hypothetical protein
MAERETRARAFDVGIGIIGQAGTAKGQTHNLFRFRDRAYQTANLFGL